MGPITMTKLRTLAAAAAFAVAGLIAGAAVTGAYAQQGEPTNLNQLLDRVRKGRQVEQAENLKRIEEFRAKVSEQRRLLSDAEAAVKREEALADQLNKTLEDNRKILTDLEKELASRAGSFRELFGQVRQAASDMSGQVGASMVSAQFPGREKVLDKLSNVRGLPTVDELEDLWFILQQEAVEQGRVARFDAEVYRTDGKAVTTEVVRVGPFTAVADNKYLGFETDRSTGVQQLRFLGRQPGGALPGAASRLMDVKPGEVESLPVDPSRGQLLKLLIDFPTLRERIAQGKTVGYIIIVMGFLGLLLALWRILVLTGVSGAVAAQARNPGNPRKGNPLGRILLVAEENKGADTETLELKLDEQIVKELPKLELGLNMMKVVTAAAPTCLSPAIN